MYIWVRECDSGVLVPWNSRKTTPQDLGFLLENQELDKVSISKCDRLEFFRNLLSAWEVGEAGVWVNRYALSSARGLFHPPRPHLRLRLQQRLAEDLTRKEVFTDRHSRFLNLEVPTSFSVVPISSIKRDWGEPAEPAKPSLFCSVTTQRFGATTDTMTSRSKISITP